MRLITTTAAGNMHEAAQYINFMGLARFVLQINSYGGNSSILLRVDSYPDYVHVCQRLGQVPLSTAQYFKPLQLADDQPNNKGA